MAARTICRHLLKCIRRKRRMNRPDDAVVQSVNFRLTPLFLYTAQLIRDLTITCNLSDWPETMEK